MKFTGKIWIADKTDQKAFWFILLFAMSKIGEIWTDKKRDLLCIEYAIW